MCDISKIKFFSFCHKMLENSKRIFLNLLFFSLYFWRNFGNSSSSTSLFTTPSLFFPMCRDCLEFLIFFLLTILSKLSFREGEEGKESDAIRKLLLLELELELELKLELYIFLAKNDRNECVPLLIIYCTIYCTHIFI